MTRVDEKTTTAPLASPAPASPTRAAPTRVLRVLHVGVSNRGTWPLEKCHAETGFAPTALCDVSEEALAAARQRTGLPESACYTDYDRALREAEVDCVIICAPTVYHVPLTLKAIEAGLAVLVEKGMAPDWASAQKLARAVQQRGAVVCVAQNYRFNPVEHTITTALHDPDHRAHPGPVHTVIYNHNRVRPIPRTLIYPFASVWDMSCHHFDNLLAWLGPISELTAHSWRADWSAYEHDNNTAAHLRFRHGAHGHYLHAHDAARNTLDIQFHGERGALVFDGERLTFNERSLEQFGTRPIVEVEPAHAEGEADLLRAFHRYVVDGVEPGVSVRNNLETMAACEMTVRSIEHGRTIRREELES